MTGQTKASPSRLLLEICSFAYYILEMSREEFSVPFVHPKLPLAARLGLCWGARPARLPFSASRRKPVKLICPTRFRARRPNPHAGRPRPPNVYRKIDLLISSATSFSALRQILQNDSICALFRQDGALL